MENYRKPEDLPATIPVFPLDGALLLPRTQLPLNIFEPRYLQMIDAAMSSERVIGMIQTDHGQPESAEPALCRVGCIGRITSYAETPDHRILITLTGICRFRFVAELPQTAPYRQVTADCTDFRDDLVPGLGEDEVDRDGLLDAFRAYLDAHEMDADWDEVTAVSNEVLVNALSMMSPYGARDKQALLEAVDLKSRADVLVALAAMSIAAPTSGGEGRLQ